MVSQCEDVDGSSRAFQVPAHKEKFGDTEGVESLPEKWFADSEAKHNMDINRSCEFRTGTRCTKDKVEVGDGRLFDIDDYASTTLMLDIKNDPTVRRRICSLLPHINLKFSN